MGKAWLKKGRKINELFTRLKIGGVICISSRKFIQDIKFGLNKNLRGSISASARSCRFSHCLYSPVTSRFTQVVWGVARAATVTSSGRSLAGPIPHRGILFILLSLAFQPFSEKALKSLMQVLSIYRSWAYRCFSASISRLSRSNFSRSVSCRVLFRSFSSRLWISSFNFRSLS